MERVKNDLRIIYTIAYMDRYLKESDDSILMNRHLKNSDDSILMNGYLKESDDSILMNRHLKNSDDSILMNKRDLEKLSKEELIELLLKKEKKPIKLSLLTTLNPQGQIDHHHLYQKV